MPTNESPTNSELFFSDPIELAIPPEPVPNQIIIRFNPSASEEERNAYIDSIGGTTIQTISGLNTVVVEVPEAVASSPLPSSPIITQSEPDYYMAALGEISVPTSDPYYAQQWGLNVVAAPTAWEEIPADTPSVTVAVIDSGICNHPDLQGRILAGYDFVDNDTSPDDTFGHGCGVAGIIAANIDNEQGIAGIAPNAQIMPLRVLDGRGIGTYSNVAAAMAYAVDNGASIINLSLGGLSPSIILEDAVKYAVSHNVLVIAAAGNSGSTNVLYPAAYEPVVAVGSIDSNLQPSSFSNKGQIDLWAPGRDIWSLTLNNGYAQMSGTSFAAPYVSATAALEMAFGDLLQIDGGIVTVDKNLPQPIETIIPIETQPNSTPQDLPTDVIENTIVYTDMVYGFNVTIPYDWFVDSASGELGSHTTITNLNPESSAEEPSITILIGVLTTDKAPEVSLMAWLETSTQEEDLQSVAMEALGDYDAVVQYYATEALMGEITYINVDGKIYYFATTANSVDLLGYAHEIRSTLNIVTPFSVAQAVVESLEVRSEDTEAVASQSLSDYQLPFNGLFEITTAPTCYYTHQNKSREAFDFGMVENTDVLATQTGYVALQGIGWDDSGFGNLLRLDHGDGYRSWYAHLNSYKVSPGQTGITQGQHIAESGNTGNSEGPHLHFEIRDIASDQSVSIRTMTGIVLYSRDPNKPCQPAGTNDGFAANPIQHNDLIVLYEFPLYGGRSYIIRPRNAVEIHVLPDWIDNQASSIWIGANVCAYLYPLKPDGEDLPLSINPSSELEYASLAPWRWLKDSERNLINRPWLREWSNAGWPTTQDLLSLEIQGSSLDNDISTIVTGPRCLGSSGVDAQGRCLFGPDGTQPPSNETPPPNPTPPPTPPASGNANYVVTNASYPTSVNAGEQFHPEITVCLYNGAQLLQSRGDMLRSVDNNTYGAFPHVAVVGTVNSGSCYVFRFYNDYPITAPMQDGTYVSQWKLWVAGNWVKGTEVNIAFTVGSGGSGNPGGPQLILFDNSNFGGEQRGFGTGWHDIGNTNFNDRSGSFTLPDGWSAILFEDWDFRGQEQCFTEDNPELAHPFGNGVSSLKVFDNPNCYDTVYPPVAVCGDVILHDGGGGWFSLNGASSADLGAWSDQRTRSVEILGPYRATTYDGTNYQGFPHGPFGSGINGVGTNVSSVRVENTHSCDDPIPAYAPSYCLSDSSTWGVYLLSHDGRQLKLNSSRGNLSVHSGWNDNVTAMYVVGPYRAKAYDSEQWTGWEHGDVIEETGLRQNLGTNVSSIRVELRLDCTNPPRPPMAPVDFTISATLDSITMNWNNVENETGYRISKWDGTSFVQVAELPANTTSFTDNGLSCTELYYYQVQAFNGIGASSPTLVQADCVPNDSPSTATTATSVPWGTSQPTNGAQSSDGSPVPSCGFNVGKAVWYEYTASATGVIHISTAGTDFDTILAVFSGSPSNLTEIICNDDEGVLAGSLALDSVKSQTVSDFFGLTSYIDLPVTAGTTYYIMAAGYNHMGGNLVFSISPNEPPVINTNAALVSVTEGQIATNSGFVSDAEGDFVSLSASIGTVVNTGDGTWSWSVTSTDGPTQSQTIMIFGNDGNGGTSQISFNLIVNNVPPTAIFENVSGLIQPNGSASLSFSGQFDPSLQDTTVGFLYSFDCTNDGTFELMDSTSASFPCNYQTSGTFTALGRIKDKDGGYNDYIVSIRVNTPPTLSLLLDTVVVDEGQTASNQVRASDADGDALTITISTGSLLDNGNGTWGWNFLATDGPAQTQTVTVSVDDGNGGTAQSSFPLTVNNLAPSFELGADVVIYSGDFHNINVVFSDLGVLDTHSAVIDFGLGSGPQVATLTQGAGSGTVSGSQQYFQLGFYSIMVCVRDNDGGLTCDSQNVEVRPITVTIDIRPGSPQNNINLGSNGNIQVAIMSTISFDATSIDPLSISLSSASVQLRGNGTAQTNTRDVNGDGLIDLVVHIDTEALQLNDADTQAELTGQTFDGRFIYGVDFIRIVP